MRSIKTAETRHVLLKLAYLTSALNFIVEPRPQPYQIQSKSVPRGLGLTLKSYGTPTPPTFFKHEGGL